MARWTVIPAVYIVFRKRDEILLLLRATEYMNGYFSLPSGHLEGGESAKAAAIREAKEEVDVDIKATDLKLVLMMHRVAKERDHERIDLYFEAHNWEGEPRNAEPDKCHDLQWATASNLPDNMVPEVRAALDHIAASEVYAEYDF